MLSRIGISLDEEPLEQFDEEIRSCFFNAYKAKIVNCVTAPAAAQHIEAPINTNSNHPNNQSGFCCQHQFFVSQL